MLTALALATVVQASPASLLQAVRDRYRRFDSYTATVERDTKLKPYPGHYTQSIRWKGQGHFDLMASKKDQATTPSMWRVGSSGGATWPGPLTESDVVSFALPKFEASQNQVLAWLEASPDSDFLLNPPPGTRVTLSMGSATSWHDMAVRQIHADIDGRDMTAENVYVSADDRWLVGIEFFQKEPMGYLIYSNQRENPIVVLTHR